MTINCYTLPDLCKQLVCLRRQQNHDDISSGCNGKQKGAEVCPHKKETLNFSCWEMVKKKKFECFKDFIR